MRPKHFPAMQALLHELSVQTARHCHGRHDTRAWRKRLHGHAGFQVHRVALAKGSDCRGDQLGAGVQQLSGSLGHKAACAVQAAAGERRVLCNARQDRALHLAACQRGRPADEQLQRSEQRHGAHRPHANQRWGVGRGDDVHLAAAQEHPVHSSVWRQPARQMVSSLDEQELTVVVADSNHKVRDGLGHGQQHPHDEPLVLDVLAKLCAAAQHKAAVEFGRGRRRRR